MEMLETTVASEWLCNPLFASDAFWRKRAAQTIREHAADDDPNARSNIVGALAECLEEGVTGQAGRLLGGLGLYQALIELALERIDWSSVAETLLKQSSERQGWQAVEALLATTEKTKSLTSAHTARTRDLPRR